MSATDHAPVVSSRRGPAWLNPATFKGAVAIGAGLVLLFAPELSARLLHVVVGGGLVVSGASDLWFQWSGGAGGKGRRTTIESVIPIAAGVALLVWPEATIGILTLLVAGYLLIRGGSIVVTSWRQRHRTEAWWPVPLQRLREHHRQIAVVLRTVVLAALVIMVPLVFTAEGILSTAGRQDGAQAAMAGWLGEDTDLRVIAVDVDGAEVEVFLTGPGEVPPLATLEGSLTEAFGTPASVRLEHAVTEVITSEAQP